MIHEVDRVLKDLLRGGALAGSGIDVSFEAPTRDWSARRNGPVINVYLYDIREDVNRRQRGHVAVRDERDVVVKRRQPPRWFRLSYLVTAWTKQPEDEHRLISAVLATLIPREMLMPDELPGSLGALGLSVPISVAGIQTESRSLAEIWSALGGELRPSLDVVVTAPFPAYPEYDAGPPVTEGAAVRVRTLDDTDTDTGTAGAGNAGTPTAEASGEETHVLEERAHRPAQLAAAKAARLAAAAERDGGRPTGRGGPGGAAG